jgi:hypothetical protein
MRMPRWLRALSFAVHLALSVGWIGAVAAYLALDVTAATASDPGTLRSVYLAMDLVVRFAILPLAIGALISGVVISLTTRWGLFRETQVVRGLAEIALAPGATAGTLRSLGSTLVHSVGGLILLLVILGLNVYKPRGLTRYGRRKEEQRRGARSR